MQLFYFRIKRITKHTLLLLLTLKTVHYYEIQHYYYTLYFKKNKTIKNG